MHLSFWLDHFLDFRAEIHQIFALVFRKIEDTKSHSEINWPLKIYLIFYSFLGNLKTHFAITMSGALHNCAEHNAMGSKVSWVSILLLLMHLCALVKYAVIKWVIMKLNFLFFHCPLFKMKNANLISINRYAFVKNNTGSLMRSIESFVN